MNIRDLQYVVAVADEGHFGRAAVKCHISQPALSGQILKLEEYLGVTLFERTNRSVQITQIGEQIVEQARRLLVLSNEIVASARAAKDPFSGHFRLGMISTIGPYLSPLILPAIRKEMPDLSLTLVEGFTTDLEKRVADGGLDGAILATVPGSRYFKDISLYFEPFRIALPRGHRFSKKKSIDVSELAHDELLLLADGHCLRDQMLDVCHASTASTNVNTRETSLETLLALVASGDGVTLVPALVRPEGGDHDCAVVMRREATQSTGRTVRLICRETFPQSELLSRLASIVRNSVSKTDVKILNG